VSARRRFAAAALLIALLAAAAALRHPAANAAIVYFARVAGYELSYGALDAGLGETRARGLVVRAGLDGGEIFAARSLRLRYDLFAWLSGARRFGLTAFELDGPRVAIVRRRDGTFNVPVAGGGSENGAGPPLWCAGVIRDGSLTVTDDTRLYPQSRRLALEHVALRASLAPDPGVSRYQLRGELIDRERSYPIELRGTADPARGVALYRLRAAQLPLGAALDYAANTSALDFQRVPLRDVDLRVFGVIDRSGTMRYHLGGGAYLDGGRLAIGGLARPLRLLHGALRFYDDGLTFARLEGTLANVPVAVGGGVYGAAAPQLRIAATASGGAEALRGVLAFAAKQPVRGPLEVTTLIEGPATDPVVLTSVHADRADFDGRLLDAVSVLVGVRRMTAQLVGFSADYGAAAIAAAGVVAFAKPNATTLVARASGPAGMLPYGSAAFGDTGIRAFALASGTNGALETRGQLYDDGAGLLRGTFHFDPFGTGTLGPLFVARRDGGSLYARVALDRPHGTMTGYLSADRFRVALAPASADLSGRAAFGIVDPGRRLGGRAQLQVEAVRSAQLSAAGIALDGARILLASRVTGTADDPFVRIGILTEGARYRGLEAAGTAVARYRRGTLALRDAVLRLGTSVVLADGSVTGLRSSRGPRCDLDLWAPAAELAPLVAQAHLPLAAAEGSLEAKVHVAGTLRSPAVAGDVRVEGIVDGLAFDDAGAAIRADANGVSARGGRVAIGSTMIRFSADADPTSARLRVAADRADLADFDGLYDTAETLAGTGRADLEIAVEPGAFRTSGDVDFARMRYRRFDFGTARARWRTAGRTIRGIFDARGSEGRLSADASLTVPSMRPYDDLVRRAEVVFDGTARGLNLGVWLPAAGMTAPVSGHVDADLALRGSLEAISARARAHLDDGLIGAVPVRAALALRAARGRAVLENATLALPSLRASAGGSFGLRPRDALALRFEAADSDVSALIRLSHPRAEPLRGSFSAGATISGTFADPRIRARVDGEEIAYHAFTVPHLRVRLAADLHRAQLAGEADLRAGRLRAAAAVPLADLRPNANPPLDARLAADRLGLAQFAPLLGSGTDLGGTIDGALALHGTLHAPRIDGALSLDGGSFRGPAERAPISAASARLAFAGTQLRLENVRARAGPGMLEGSAVADLADPADAARTTAFAASLRARRAYLDLPAYYRGLVDGTLALSRPAGTAPLHVGGALSFSDGRIPLGAIYDPRAAKTAAAPPPDIALDLRVTGGRDVRIQGANADVAVQGSVLAGGTLAAPTLAGRFDAPDGTLNFYRLFTLQRGSAYFSNDQGVMPYLDAVATTTISQAGGGVDVTLNVTGLAPSLNVDLESSPPLERSQILALLVNAQALGVNVPGVAAASSPGGFSAAALVGGRLDQELTQRLFQPVSSGLGSALGLSNLALTINPQSGFAAAARRALGRELYAVFGQNLGYPMRQSFGLEAHPNVATALALTFYNVQGQAPFGANTVGAWPCTL
jgi:autotransporter translocation and assembly factor TamB